MARDYVLQGGDGVISVTANVAPAAVAKVIASPPPLYLPHISPTSPLQASFDQGLDHSLDPSLDERGDSDGPAAAAPPSAPEPFDVASLGDFFADPEG